MKVLVGVDGSSGCVEAVRFAAALLSPDRDQIGLYYSPPDVRPHHAAASSEIRAMAVKALADSVLAEMQKPLSEDLRKTVHKIVGAKPPKQGLLLAADDWRADLIVVGARGLGPLESLLLGSVSHHVVHRSKLPVLLVRPRPSSRVAGAPLSVLLACDQSDASRQAGALLERFTWPQGTRGRVVSVIESLTAGDVPMWLENMERDPETKAMAETWAKEHEAERSQTREQMAEYCAKLHSIFAASEPLVAEGNAAQQILRAAEDVAADLIVMGAHGKNALERIFLGSTSDKILSHAPCSVLIVRERDKP